LRFRSRRVAKINAKKYIGKYVINNFSLEGADLQRVNDTLVMTLQFDFNAV
jgi:hypothetical protein